MSDYENSPIEGEDETAFEDLETTPASSSSRPPRKRGGSNRSFWIILGVLAGIFVLALIVLIVLATIILPGRNATRLQDAAQINAQNTATSVAATNNSILQTQLARPTETLPATSTLAASSTPVVVISTNTAEPTITSTQGGGVGAAPEDLNSRTQTLAALLTQAARTATTTSVARTGTKTVTALPETGFADQVGLPGLAGLALLLIIVVFLVRRLRMANSH